MKMDRFRGFFLLAAAAALISLFMVPPASAQGLRSGAWLSGFGQGWQEIGTRLGSNGFTIACDIANSPDHSGTHLSVSIGGNSPPPGSDVVFEVDGAAITMPADEKGRVSISDCAECAGKFRELWYMLRQGRQLQVFASNGASALFSLRGSSRVMPPAPCPTKLAASGEQPGGATAEGAQRTLRADCIPLRVGFGQGQAEVVGMARPDRGVCYALETARGQVAQIEVLTGPNIAVTVPGVADARERLEFDTDGGAYEVLVIQVQRADRARPYRLRIAMREGSLEPRAGQDSLAQEFARRAEEGEGGSPGPEAPASTSSGGTSREVQVSLPILGKSFDLTLSHAAGDAPPRDPAEAVSHFPTDLRAAEGEALPDEEILGVVEERSWAAQIQYEGVLKALLAEETKKRPPGQADEVEEELRTAFRDGTGDRFSEDVQQLYDEQLALLLVAGGLRRALGYAAVPEGGDGHFTVPELPAHVREAFTQQGFDADEAYRSYHRLRAAYRAADFGLLDRAIVYPLIIIDEGPGMTIGNLEELLGADVLVMNQALREIVLAQKFSDLFVRDQGAMFGNGALWMTPACPSGDCARRLALRTINLTGLKPLEPVSLQAAEPEEPAAPPVTGEEQAEAPAPAAANEAQWEAAGDRLRAQIETLAKDFCRSVHDTDGTLHADAIKEVPGSDGGAPDLLVSFRGIQCEGVEDAPTKQGGFCGLTRDGLKCQVEVYSFKNGEYAVERSYLE